MPIVLEFEVTEMPNAEATERLIVACQYGDLGEARDAIRNGADVNAGEGDYTPLHWAVQEGHAEVAALLLDRGARIDSRDREGFTPLQKAVGEGYVELARLLIRRGADVNDDCNGHGTPLHTACAYSRVECVEVLLDAGADLRVRDGEGKIPADYAAMYGYAAIQHILSAKGGPTT